MTSVWVWLLCCEQFLLNDVISCFFFSIVYHFSNLAHLYFFLFSLLVIPAPTNAHTFSCPMVSTTTVQPVPPACTAKGGVWAQCRAVRSPSSLFPPHLPPPPPAPLAHGHVLPLPCCQTTLTSAWWVPPWCLHHESLAGRFVHRFSFGDPPIFILLYSRCIHHANPFDLFYCLRFVVECVNTF